MSFGHTLYPLMLGQGGHTRALEGLKQSVSCSPLGYGGNARALKRLKQSVSCSLLGYISYINQNK
jgi:hypothetical protein